MMLKNVIAFMNMKGGVGKTTICVNIAGSLANMGYKVLLIDMDPQMNSTQYLLDAQKIEEVFNNENKSYKTIYSLYTNIAEDNLSGITGDECEDEELVEEEDIIYEGIRDRFDLICGDLRMTNISDTDGTITDILNLYISDNNLKEKYDFIFIDCPPTQSIYTTSAFKASDFYLLIIKPDYLSTIGISLFENIIKKFNQRRGKEDKIKNLGIITNLMPRKNEYHNEKLQEVKDRYKFKTVFENHIFLSSSIAKASEDHILMYEKKGCKSPIRKLTAEFLKVYEKAVGGNDNDR